MIITKSFIEMVLIKAEKHLSERVRLHETVEEFAFSLVGLEALVADKKIGRHMRTLQEEDKWKERNLFVPLARELYKNVDWGFKEGDKVRYWFSAHTRRVGYIKRITDDNTAEMSDIILPFTLIEKYEEEPVQLSLFA